MSSNSQFKYDVAISYAGADRAYVERVVAALKKEHINVFYDQDAEVYLWGKDLGDALDEIYRLQSRYVVIFVSEHYAKSIWTNHERKSALARALEEKREYVLPARFDDTTLAGLRPTTKYINIHRVPPESFASMILQKVVEDKASDSSTGTVPIHIPAAPSREVREVVGYAILSLADESLLPIFKLFGDEPPTKQPDNYEDVYFDDIEEMNQILAAINTIVAKAKEMEERGEDRHQSFERVWKEEVIARASQYVPSRPSQSPALQTTNSSPFKYLIWGILHDYAPMIGALRTKQLLQGASSVVRDDKEVYFKNVAVITQIPGVIQKAVQDAGGDNQVFMQLLFKAAMRLRTFGIDVSPSAG